jgi:hypothetical protein
MRRRPPHLIELSANGRAELHRLVGDGRTQQRVARRARILLAMSRPETMVEELADQVAQTRATIWALCRRYEAVGTEAVFDAPRSGRPWEISPLAEGRD